MHDAAAATDRRGRLFFWSRAVNRSLIGHDVEIAGEPDSRWLGRRGVVVNAWDSADYAIVTLIDCVPRLPAIHESLIVAVCHLRILERTAEGSDVRA